MQVVHLEARPAEDERRRRALEVEDAAERRPLVAAGDDVGGLAHLREPPGRRGLLRDRDAHGVLQVLRGDRPDPGRERRREQRGLARLRRRREDRVEVLGEPHVEHLVRLVEDEDRQAVELQGPAVHVVERAAGRRDDDVDPALEGVELRHHGGAAVDRKHADSHPLSVAVHGLGELHRELTRRDEDEGGRREAAPGLAPDPVEDRERERRRLAGPRGCLRENVTSREERRDRLSLDGRRLLVAQGRELPNEPVVEPEAREGGGGRRRLHGRILSPAATSRTKRPVLR